MLKKAFIAAGLNGKIATHSLRKSYAQWVYEQSGDIYLVKELLGHRNVATTHSYLGVNYADAREAVEAIALDLSLTERIFCHLQPYEMEILSSSRNCPFGQFTKKRGRRNAVFGALTPRL